MPFRVLLAATIAAALTAPAAAQQAAEKPCTAPEHRQFDFWLGSWEVRDPQGKVVGSNRISSILNGCVLLEEWTAAGGSAGKSFNAWDARRGVWHQTWVDDQGGLLRIEGGLDGDGAMVLGSTGKGPDGKAIRQRITWTPLEDGRVRQHWETSQDDGTSWTTVFDGFYARVSGRD